MNPKIISMKTYRTTKMERHAVAGLPLTLYSNSKFKISLTDGKLVDKVFLRLNF